MTESSDQPSADLSFLPGAYHLVAIHPDTAHVVGHHFGEDQAAAEAWANQWNASGANCYWTSNVVRRGVHTKPTKAQIERPRIFHVDLDDTQDPSRLRALGASVIINSGNGLQGIWHISGPCTAAEAEEVNRRIAHELGADHCHNIERLLRVPGTINYPNAIKRARGRVAVPATLIERHGTAYDVESMLHTFPPVPERPEDGEAEHDPGEWEPIALDDLQPPLRGTLAVKLDCVPPHGERSEHVAQCCRLLAEAGYPASVIMGLLMDPRNPGLNEHIADQPDPERAARRKLAFGERFRRDPAAELEGVSLAVPAGVLPIDTPAGELAKAIPLYSPNSPVSTANHMASYVFADPRGVLTCRRYRGEFFQYRHGRYVRQDGEAMKKIVRDRLAGAVKKNADGKIVPFNPKREHVAEVVDALGSEMFLDGTRDAPMWIVDHNRPPATELYTAANGLVHLPTGTLYESTPLYFNTAGSDVRYDPAAPTPPTWLGFLDDVYGADHEARETLREWMGYLLTPDTRHQKMLLRISPKRGGKGTEFSVMESLLGRDSTTGFSLPTMADRFALMHWPGRLLAYDPDVRIDGKSDLASIGSLLLKISGEDSMTVDRKHIAVWQGRLTTRIALGSNEPPRFDDTSGALASRFVIIHTKASFYGREDVGLKGRLRAELPGILNWAIDGWRRLNARGGFKMPPSGEDMARTFDQLASPLRAFVDERCKIDPEGQVPKRDLFSAYQSWSNSAGITPMSKTMFGAKLRSVVPTLTDYRGPPGHDGKRPPEAYKGVELPPL